MGDQSTSALPAQKGSYGLILELCRPIRIPIGRLGVFTFPTGIYVYCGSARGAGGIRGRLGRHVAAPAVRPRWHIDYFRAEAEVIACFYHLGEVSLECVWSRELALLAEAHIPVKGFGNSDCRAGCAAHLVAFPVEMPLVKIINSLPREYKPVWHRMREMD